MDAVAKAQLTQVGVVAIGQDEGDRLVRAIESAVGQVPHLVYVDSGSHDGSPDRARRLGADVIALDERGGPFTAARARNAGLRRLLELDADLAWVQFVDGDSELEPGWLERGATRLAQDPSLAGVCGRLIERDVERSVYKRLLDLEWRRPAGQTDACGGNAMYRIAALRTVGGFAPALSCGEEPELCLRLRRAGWRLERLAVPMARHDGELTRLGQWWHRSERGGWAAAEGAALHGDGPERYNQRRARSAWGWGAAVPLLAVALAWPTSGLSFLAAGLAYALLAAWVTLRRLWSGDRLGDAALYGTFCALGKLPAALGQTRYWFSRWAGRAPGHVAYDRQLEAAA